MYKDLAQNLRNFDARTHLCDRNFVNYHSPKAALVTSGVKQRQIGLDEGVRTDTA